MRRRKDGGEGEHKNVPIPEIYLTHGLLDLKQKTRTTLLKGPTPPIGPSEYNYKH